jgi:MFS transporter, DHA1 family, tetracycline resistance protein
MLKPKVPLSFETPAPEPEDAEPEDDVTFAHYLTLRKIRHLIRENGTLFAMFSVVFVNLVGFGLVVPLISFFAQSLNAEAWQVTLMFTAYSLGQFFAEPLCGRVSDIVGRKPILIVTTALSVVFYIALAFSKELGGIWAAIIIRFFSGLSSGNISTIQGYIADCSRPEQRAGRMSMIGAAFSLGFVAGPVLGLMVREEAGLSGFQMPLFIAAGMAGIATLGVMLFVRETRKPSQKSQTQMQTELAELATPTLKQRAKADMAQTFKEALANPVIVPVIASTLCYMGALATLESTFGLWAGARYGWGSKEISIIFLMIGFSAAVMQMVFTRPLVRRYGEARVLASGLFVFGLSFVLQAINHNPHFIAPLVVLGTLGQSVIFANISAMISKAAPPERQGAMLGLNMSTGAIARIIGPVFAGLFFTNLGPDSSLWMGAFLCIPAAVLALRAGRGEKQLNPRP